MRRRNLVIAAGVVAVLLAWLGWKVVGGHGSGGTSDQGGSGSAASDPSEAGARRFRSGSGAPGQVSGTVLDAAEAASICAPVSRSITTTSW